MVSAIFFMKDLLMVIFTKLLETIKSKTVLSLFFVISAAFLSAFLDALTVTAVLISVTLGFYKIFEKKCEQNVNTLIRNAKETKQRIIEGITNDRTGNSGNAEVYDS